MIGTISRKSMNMNTQFRSERMEIDIINKDGRLSPGMFAEVLLHLNSREDALSVPKSAVVTSTERKYVLVVRNEKIIKVDVSTGNESTDKIEVYGLLNPGDMVIINANDEIKETI
jgi:multidrug efflux pump subunit AcrA (membrane-fusion protein)